MTRLIVLWEQPATARAEEVEAMARWELGRLATDEAVNELAITRLEPVHGRSAWYGWLLEVELYGDGAALDSAVDGRMLELLLGDLRQLGLHPIVMARGAPGNAKASG